MSTNGVRGSRSGPRALEGGSDEMADLAAELNALTDRMEAEWNERRTIGADHAHHLAELRRRFEQLLED